MLVDEAEVLAVVDLPLDAARLLGRGLVVEQQHDQAPDRPEAFVALGAAQLVALGRGQVAALAVIEDHRLVLAGAVADARHELTGPREHRGEAVDAFGRDFPSGVGRELDLLERRAHDAPLDPLLVHRCNVEQGW